MRNRIDRLIDEPFKCHLQPETRRERENCIVSELDKKIDIRTRRIEPPRHRQAERSKLDTTEPTP